VEGDVRSQKIIGLKYPVPSCRSTSQIGKSLRRITAIAELGVQNSVGIKPCQEFWGAVIVDSNQTSRRLKISSLVENPKVPAWLDERPRQINYCNLD
jgi:hypothetical protein